MLLSKTEKAMSREEQLERFVFFDGVSGNLLEIMLKFEKNFLIFETNHFRHPSNE